MTAPQPPRTGLRRAGAIFAGFLVVAILSTLGDVVLHAAGVFPPWGEPMSDPLFALAVVYRTIFTVAGGYVTARLSPDRSMRDVAVLGVIGTILGLVGLIATWNAGPAYATRWYPIALVVLAFPSVWVGGKLARR